MNAADDLLALIDATFAADDADSLNEAHEEALIFDEARGRVCPALRQAMRETLTAQGIRLMQRDAAFAAYV